MTKFGRVISTKQRSVSILMIICLVAVMVSMLPAVTASAASDSEIETDTYYYDRLGEQAQRCYLWLKDYYDSNSPEPGVYDFDFLSWLPANPTEEEYRQLALDFAAADDALKADDPRYEWTGRVAGWGYASPGETPVFSLRIDHFDLFTADTQNRADARIRQIAATVGTGDRYTKLRKLTHYLLSNTFYDPYLDMINMEGNHSLVTRGHHYNQSVYGLLLKNIAVCDGFSQSVKVLCDALDIPCIIVGNTGHAWNLVQMENGGWYLLDITNACRFGRDGELPFSLDYYFENKFLNNDDAFGMYGDPYMISVDGIRYVTDFPEMAAGQYQYTGSTTDFSYTVPNSTYNPGSGSFSYRVNEDKTTCTITNYVGQESGDLTIPGELDGYKVTAIEPYAFYYCTGFTGKLTIPDSVESIGKAAFAGCYGLTSVELPDNLTKLGIGAFIGCKGLTEVKLPDLLDEVGDYAFYDCNKLISVTFGSHIQTVGNGAFGKIGGGAVFKAPANSAAQQYASDNGITFQAAGTLCGFQDVDGAWEFDNDSHFHTCQHGGRFDYGSHTNELGVFNCGDTCDVCKAEACTSNGLMKKAFTLINEEPATCNSMGYTGDWQCICGTIFRYGEYVGEPTEQHTPADEAWEFMEDYHYQACSCGYQLQVASHFGGTATATQRAKCSLCGAEYGALSAGDHAPTPDVTPPTQDSGGGTGLKPSEPTVGTEPTGTPETESKPSEPTAGTEPTGTPETQPQPSTGETTPQAPTNSPSPTEDSVPADSDPSPQPEEFPTVGVVLTCAIVCIAGVGSYFGIKFLHKKQQK